jgi:hypothetical protein
MKTVQCSKLKFSLTIVIGCVAWLAIAAAVVISLAARCDAAELRRFLESYGVPEGPAVFLLPVNACAGKK